MSAPRLPGGQLTWRRARDELRQIAAEAPGGLDLIQTVLPIRSDRLPARVSVVTPAADEEGPRGEWRALVFAPALYVQFTWRRAEST